MLLSNLIVPHKQTKPQFAPLLFLGLIAVFVGLGQTKPIIGLVGLGTTIIVTAVLVELNRRSIWENYSKTYRKQKGLRGLWTKPNPVYYNINVLFLWPFLMFLGVLCLVAAYALS